MSSSYSQVESFADMPAEADAAEREWKATQTVERYAAVLRYLADNATPEARQVLLGALDVCERGDLLPPRGAQCQACTGGPDSGRGHTMRGDCAGAL